MRARTIGFSALAFAALSFPLVAMAQLSIGIGPSGSGLGGILGVVGSLLNTVILIFITLAIVVFFWGLIQYILKLGGEDGGKGGIKLMIWGLIALFIMVSIWGLIRILQTTVGVNSNESSLRPAPVAQ